MSLRSEELAYSVGSGIKSPKNRLLEYMSQYEKIRTVGKGAFGTAVLCRRKADAELLVLKEINLLELNGTERQMALNEVDVLALLHHPNIVRYLGSFESDGTLIIEMEYADGGTLAQLISRLAAPMQEADILMIFSQIVAAIDYMHGNNILHRDLKTANVFLTKDRTIKVGDLGISKVMSTKAQAQTVLGTPYYISPEMCEGKQYDIKSDMWALGCILYEMACREKTFQGPNLPALVSKIMQGSYNPLPSMYSAGLKSLVKSLLKKDPNLRPTASTVLQRIEGMTLKMNQRSAGSSGLDSRTTNRERSVLYQLSGHDSSFSLVPIHLPPQSRILKVAASNTHCIALTSDMFVYAWGEGKRGQLGLDEVPIWVEEPVLVESLNSRSITMIGAGDGFSVFVSDSGMLLTCGDGSQGCLGHGDSNSISTPKLVEKLLSVDVVDVSCGENQVGVLSSDGLVQLWGKLPTQIAFSPQEENIPKQYEVKAISCGPDSSAVVTSDGQLLVYGMNSYNKLGLNSYGFGRSKTIEFVEKFTLVQSMKKWRVVKIDIGKTHSIVVTRRGCVLTMGTNSENQLGHSGVSPTQVQLMSDHHVTMGVCGPTYSVVGTKENALYFWGTRFTQGYEESPENTMVSSGTLETEVVLKPQGILMLYSSESEVAQGQSVVLNSILALWHCILVLVDTTALLPQKERANLSQPTTTEIDYAESLDYDSLGPIPDWIKAELAQSEDTFQEDS